MFANLKNVFGGKSKAPQGPIALAIEQATADGIEDVDWAVIVNVVDLINSSPDGCEQAINALKRRMKAPSPVTVNYALSVLDTLVKNVGYPFIVELCKKENSRFIKKFLIAEDLAPENRGRMLELIRDWASNNPEPAEMRKLFNDLVNAGYRFPGTVPAVGAQIAIRQLQYVPVGFAPVATAAQAGPVVAHLPPEERRKYVEFDCNLSKNNVQLLGEALNFASPDEDLSKNEIVREFRAKCQEMLNRVNRLVGEVQEEDLLDSLLNTSGDLSGVLAKYDEMIESRVVEAAKQASYAEPTPPENASASAHEGYKVDLPAGVAGSSRSPFGDFDLGESEHEEREPLGDHDNDSAKLEDPFADGPSAENTFDPKGKAPLTPKSLI